MPSELLTKTITNKSNDNKSGDESRGNSNAMITLNLNIDFVYNPNTRYILAMGHFGVLCGTCRAMMSTHRPFGDAVCIHDVESKELIVDLRYTII